MGLESSRARREGTNDRTRLEKSAGNDVHHNKYTCASCEKFRQTAASTFWKNLHDNFMAWAQRCAKLRRNEKRMSMSEVIR